jgi:curved DNA-binding protein CbpA
MRAIPMNAFATIGIETQLVIDDERLRAAYRDAGRTAHPDTGGDEASFAALNEAFEMLSSPSRRLRHWLELRDLTVETRGPVAPAIMDLFSRIGEASQRADSLVRRRDEAKSALGLALLERETQECREEVERSIALVEAAIGNECAAFSNYQNSDIPDVKAASATARNLAFLEKWRAGLRSAFARLV